jgi:hypothetical protein
MKFGQASPQPVPHLCDEFFESIPKIVLPFG